MTAAQPNILIVMVDQLAPAFLPAHGHKIVKTPNLDALAASGIVFESAYCASPLCSPSRASFMSGLLPSHSRVYDNASEFAAAIPTYAHHLRALGYRTVLSGKMHFCGPDQLHGFEARLTTDIYPADFGWTPDWDDPDERPNWYHNMGSVRQAGLCVRTNQLDYDDEVTFRAERAIYDIARSNDGRPFLLVASLTHPHDPFAITEKYWSLYRPEDIDPPLPGVARDPHSLRLREVCAMDAVTITDDQVRNARRAYYGAISYVDDNLGTLLAALRATRLDEDTIIVFLSDHGEMLGERGLWYKMSYLEGAARVPLVISAPGRFKPGRVAASVSLVDILPTLVDLAGEDVGALSGVADGRSLKPHLTGGAGHDEVIGEYLAEGVTAPMVMIRRGRWKFIHCAPDPDQLFDCAADPREEANLAEDAAFAETLAQFRAEVATRWDLAAIDRNVRQSQQRRRVVDAALHQGAPKSWDFQPVSDASRQYVRNTSALDDSEARARFPRVAKSEP